jgi:hypothetical protein
MARKSMDAVTLLKADHRKVEELFDEFGKARESDRKKDLVEQICTELCIHTMIEEEIFYPACQGKIEEEDVIDESYVEHDGAKVLVAELMQSAPDEEFYDAKVSVLSEEIRHHVKEEEKRGDGLMAQAKKAGLDLDALGERLMMRKQELMEQIATQGLPTIRTRSFTGHHLEQGKPVASRAGAAAD